jgi:hypothetical protein
MSEQTQKLQLCPRCEELRHIRREFRLCDPCELEVLRIWQANAIALQEEQRVA